MVISQLASVTARIISAKNCLIRTVSRLQEFKNDGHLFASSRMS